LVVFAEPDGDSDGGEGEGAGGLELGILDEPEEVQYMSNSVVASKMMAAANSKWMQAHAQE
jgi:hypothetical protein